MRKLLLLLVLALSARVAQADNGILYVGGGIARDDLKGITATNSDLTVPTGRYGWAFGRLAYSRWRPTTSTSAARASAPAASTRAAARTLTIRRSRVTRLGTCRSVSHSWTSLARPGSRAGT